MFMLVTYLTVNDFVYSFHKLLDLALIELWLVTLRMHKIRPRIFILEPILELFSFLAALKITSLTKESRPVLNYKGPFICEQALYLRNQLKDRAKKEPVEIPRL